MKHIYLITILFFSFNTFSQNDLLGEWFLHSTFIDGVQAENTFVPSFYIDFSLETGPNDVDYLMYDGSSICNFYLGEYRIESTNEVSFINFGSTLAWCHPFDNSYLGFFLNVSNISPQNLNYTISGSGNNETLILTDQDGDYVLYGRQPLSVSENELNSLDVSLKENPVKDKLLLETNVNRGNKFNYEIYTIEGQLVQQNTVLENNTINVNDLNSGIYFLMISTKDNFKKTVKFVKH